MGYLTPSLRETYNDLTADGRGRKLGHYVPEAPSGDYQFRRAWVALYPPSDTPDALLDLLVAHVAVFPLRPSGARYVVTADRGSPLHVKQLQDIELLGR